MEKPPDLHDRDREWAALADFAVSSSPGLRVGVLYGRRRQGKSFLLRRLARATGGLYHQAQEVARVPALGRFADDVSARLGLPAGQLAFSSWEEALRTALGLAGPGAAAGSGMAGPRRLVFLDELPYLLAHSPEIPSVLQQLYDESHDEPGAPGAGVVVCGSALSVMSDLLSGSRALRGRTRLDLLLQPFGYRDAAAYWKIGDPEVAFQIDAVLGGTPGYRPLIEHAVPSRPEGLPGWLAGSLLDPAHAMFGEAGYLLREDPRITDRAVYNSILQAVAAGRTTPTQIAATLGRDARSLAHPLDVLLTAGFVRREDDVVLQRRPSYQVADPVVRFAQLVIEPQRVLLEERAAEQAWAAARSAYSSLVLGPHFERLCVEWTARHAGDRWPQPVGEVGPTVVNDPAGRAQAQLDVVALPRGVPRHQPGAPLVVLGEAKASARPRTLADLERLDYLRELLVHRKVEAGGAVLVLFGRSGFTPELSRAAGRRADVHLVDLATLYTG